MCKNNVPFNAVSRSGFQHLMNVLEPRYKVPSKTTFSKNKVVKLYDITRESVTKHLRSAKHFSSTPLHVVISRLNSISWLHDSLDRQQLELENDISWNKLRHVTEDDTANNLAESMHDVLFYLKLHEEKQVAITTDNVANI